MKNIINDNFETCKSIANDLDNYLNGLMYRFDGDTYYADDLTQEQLEEAEQLGVFDYFSDLLDIKYICDSNREVEDVKILIAYGGPNIWINTESMAVELYWCNESAQCEISSEAADALREFAIELFNC